VHGERKRARTYFGHSAHTTANQAAMLASSNVERPATIH
jgi:hypothetical protein